MTWEIKCFLKSVPGVCEWADANSNQNASAFSCAFIWFTFSCAHPRFCHKDGKCLETVQLWVNFKFSQRRILRMQLTATNVWSQIWESKCHLGQILQRRVRCSWQGFKQKRDIFSPLLRCVKMTVAFPGSVKKMTPACLPTRVRFAIIFRFYKSSFDQFEKLPTPRWIPDMGGMRWPVPASWRKMQHILPKRFFCRNIYQDEDFCLEGMCKLGGKCLPMVEEGKRVR